MHPSHVRHQQVFWRNSPKERLKVYELRTLSFGERPALYLAKRSFRELTYSMVRNFLRLRK